MPEFYIIIARKIFSRFCWGRWGGARAASALPSSTPMQSISRLNSVFQAATSNVHTYKQKESKKQTYN